jgi:hypothetical protein
MENHGIHFNWKDYKLPQIFIFILKVAISMWLCFIQYLHNKIFMCTKMLDEIQKHWKSHGWSSHVSSSYFINKCITTSDFKDEWGSQID